MCQDGMKFFPRFSHLKLILNFDDSRSLDINFHHSFVEYLKREKWVYFDIFIWRHDANGDEMELERHQAEENKNREQIEINVEL